MSATHARAAAGVTLYIAMTSRGTLGHKYRIQLLSMQTDMDLIAAGVLPEARPTNVSYAGIKPYHGSLFWRTG